MGMLSGQMRSANLVNFIGSMVIQAANEECQLSKVVGWTAGYGTDVETAVLNPTRSVRLSDKRPNGRSTHAGADPSTES